MKDKAKIRVERNKMMKEITAMGIKIDRSGMTVKQQIPLLNKVLAPKRKEEQEKKDAEIKAKQAIADAKKKAIEDKFNAEEAAKKAVVTAPTEMIK